MLRLSGPQPPCLDGFIQQHLGQHLRSALDSQTGPLPEHLPLLIRHQLAVAVRPAFLFAACVCVAALVLVVFGLREEPLRRSVEEQPLESGI